MEPTRRCALAPEALSLYVDPSCRPPPRPASRRRWRAADAGRPAPVWTPPRSSPPEVSAWRKCRRTSWRRFGRVQWPSWCFSERDEETVKTLDVIGQRQSFFKGRKCWHRGVLKLLKDRFTLKCRFCRYVLDSRVKFRQCFQFCSRSLNSCFK